MVLLFSAIILFSLYNVEAYTDDLVDITFRQRDSAFFISENQSLKYDSSTLFATASNSDRYEIDASLGLLRNSLTFLGDRLIRNSKLHVTVHTFDTEISEETKTLHVLCHASYYDKVNELKSESKSLCCVISVNASYFNELTSCVIVIDHLNKHWICHASMRLPPALWRQKQSPEVTLSYMFTEFASFSDNIKLHDVVHDNFKRCHLSLSDKKSSFTPLPSVSIAYLIPDATRDLGRSLLLQIPRRELKINENFFVTVRLKSFDDVSDFTLRFEIPPNTYVEFVRVIWPPGVNTVTSSSSSPHIPMSSITSGDANSYIEINEFHDTQIGSTMEASEKNDMRSRNMWDVFHRSVINSKRNVTEIIARFREDLVTTNPTSKYSSATEIYKLQFRVNKPQSSSPGRVAPRIFWSLASLSRRNSPDHTISGSPVVTRLNIEPSEFKHITMVLKTSALVNLAVLTGQPTIYPVWVYGLTHDLKLIDITNKATCHTGDDAVIHFAQDICSKLGFSGAELDGSPGLPLVAKMDGRSASATLLVWFPKAPSLKLIVESGLSSNYELIDQSASNPITIKRLATEIIESHSNFHKSPWTNQKNSEESPQFFQYFRVRVMARFILASSVLHDKDVLGGRINQYVDVTEFTAHRLRLEYTHEQLMNTVSLNSDRNVSNSMPELIHFKSPARLLTIGDVSSHRQLHQTSISMYGNKHLKPLRVWIIGQHAGSVKIHLAPIDRTLVNAFIPPGLAKQLKDPSSKISNLQLQQHNDNNQSEKFHYVATSNNDNLFKEPSITVRVTDKTSIWPVGISAQLVTDFSLYVSHSSGIDDARQILTSNLSSLQNSSINDNNNNNDENQFPPTPTERMPLLSGVYSLYVELKGSKLTHSGSINSEFNQPLKNMHRKMSILSNDDDYYVNETDRTSGGRMASSVGFLVVWIHLSDGSSILWNRMTEIYEQLHGRDKIPLNLSIKNCRPDLFWIETSSSGLLESKLRSVRGTPSSSAFPTSESSHFTSRSSFFRQRTNRYSKLARRSIRMKPNLLRTGDHSVSMNQHVHKHLLANELGENITSVNLSNFWSGPMVWLLHPGIKYSGDLLEVGLTTPSGNILVPHVRIRGEIMTPKDGIPVNEYLRSNNRYEFSAKGAQENRTSVDNTHDSMAFKDAPGFQMTHLTSSQAGTEIKSSKMPVKSNPRHLIYSSTSDGASSNTVPINSDDISVDDRSSILSDVGGGNNNQIENNESVKDRENKLSNPTAGSNRNGINGSKVRTSDSWTSTRPVLELSMYILLGLFAVVGLVFAVNCGVVIVRYRWEKMNMNQTSGNANTTYTGDSSTASSCEQAKNTKPVNYIVSTPLPYTDEISNNSKEVIGQNQIVSSISSSPKCKWIHRSKSDADNQEKLLGTNNIHDDNYNVNSNKKRKRAKRSATSVFTGRQKHKPLLHRDSSWVWVGRQHVVDENNEIDRPDYNSNISNYRHQQQLNQLLPYDSELSNFTTTTLTATINNDSVTSNNINLPKTVSNLSRPNKCSLRYNQIKKNSTTAVLSVGEADMLLLQSPYRESVWQDTLRSDTNESDSRFVYLTSGNFAQQFGYTAAMQPNSFLFHQMSTPVNNTPKSECQTLGRQLKRHTTAYTQRNYQGQECSIRIISNPMSDGNKRQHCHPQHQQFTNPQLFLSDYSSETINPTHQTNNNALTKSVMVSDSWLDNSNPLMLTGSVSASLHRKQITPVYLHDECTRTLCSNSDLLNANGILSTTTSKSKIHFSGVANFPVMSPTTHRLQAPCSMPCALPVGLPNFYQEESSWISSSQHQHEINEDWTKADYPNQPFLITKDTHCNDSLEYKNQSTIDRPDRTTVDMLDVSSPVCPLNSPWQVRRPLEKSIKSSQFDCCSNNQPCELHSPLLDQVNFNDNHLHFNEVLELNETGSYSQNPPYPPIRTTSRGAIAYHTLGHVKRSNNNDTNNYQPRPLSLPQSFHVSNELYSALNRTDSSRECVKLLDENNHKEHKTKRGNYGNNSNASEMYQDCLFSSSYDILSKYVNKQQSPSEESLWWYHPVHQKRRRKRKHESKKNADDKSNHNQHHHHHYKLPISFQKQQHQQIDMYISSVSEQSSDLSIPMMNKIDSADVNVDDSMDFILNHNIKMNSKGNLCEHTAENDFNTNTEVNKSEVNIHDSEKLQTSPTTQSSQSHKHSATIHNTTDKRQYFNSQSDLSWDQELLCLSHDRLVAYFAEMKESNA